MIAIIPARYESVRLPGKMLLPIAGRPLILHTLERAKSAATVSRVIVATDDERIFKVVTAEGEEAVMTSPKHLSGTDRIAEVAKSLPEGSIVVNVQGDEPAIAPATIDAAVRALIDDAAVDVSTTWEPITSVADVLSPDVVKVVTSDDGLALYFSRSPIPFLRDESDRYGGIAAAIHHDAALLKNFKKHSGLYVYRREFLLRYAAMPPTQLEQTEMLEQLRALENGARIKAVKATARSIGVDTMEDFERARKMIEKEAAAG